MRGRGKRSVGVVFIYIGVVFIRTMLAQLILVANHMLVRLTSVSCTVCTAYL